MRRNLSALLFFVLVLPFWAGHDLLHAADAITHESPLVQCAALHGGSLLTDTVEVPEPVVFTTPDVRISLPAAPYSVEQRQKEVRGPPVC
jgi:hypothetical protein